MNPREGVQRVSVGLYDLLGASSVGASWEGRLLFSELVE